MDVSERFDGQEVLMGVILRRTPSGAATSAAWIALSAHQAREAGACDGIPVARRAEPCDAMGWT